MCKIKKEKKGIEETTEETSKKNEVLESKIQGTYNGGDYSLLRQETVVLVNIHVQ